VGKMTQSRSQVEFDHIVTILGSMVAASFDHRICLLQFFDRQTWVGQIQRLREEFGVSVTSRRSAVIQALDGQLQEYFAGQREQFSVPIFVRGTSFQKKVWTELQKIAFGHTTKYGAIARAIGRANAARAVGRANGNNRIAILIPCHRVVRSDGSIGGYAGGIGRKRCLIDHERWMADARRNGS
jgi:AraC family transcriptional regulator of adaptative response/methylated-DNA-[protein]-cysteine methyltransferase